MRKKHITLLAGVAAALLCASCHKTCTCFSYDGAEHTYTSEELDAEGVNCSAMTTLVNQRFQTAVYSYCRWD